MISIRQFAACCALGLLAAAVQADLASDEVDFLIRAVGASDCTFVRNGKNHSAEDAAAHLQMKYRRGKKYARTAELFITRLASKSSWSGRPYMMMCNGGAPQKTADWLSLRLVEFRGHEDGAKI